MKVDRRHIKSYSGEGGRLLCGGFGGVGGAGTEAKSSSEAHQAGCYTCLHTSFLTGASGSGEPRGRMRGVAGLATHRSQASVLPCVEALNASAIWT